MAPVLKVITFPLNFLTFGLAYGLINLLIVLLSADLLDGVDISGNLISKFFTALVVSISLSLIQSSLEQTEDWQPI